MRGTKTKIYSDIFCFNLFFCFGIFLFFVYSFVLVYFHLPIYFLVSLLFQTQLFRYIYTIYTYSIVSLPHQATVCTLQYYQNNFTSTGLNTALVEQDDFSSGTSSRSTKLIHGGVRYLQKALLGEVVC